VIGSVRHCPSSSFPSCPLQLQRPLVPGIYAFGGGIRFSFRLMPTPCANYCLIKGVPVPLSFIGLLLSFFLYSKGGMFLLQRISWSYGTGACFPVSQPVCSPPLPFRGHGEPALVRPRKGRIAALAGVPCPGFPTSLMHIVRRIDLKTPPLFCVCNRWANEISPTRRFFVGPHPFYPLFFF